MANVSSLPAGYFGVLNGVTILGNEELASHILTAHLAEEFFRRGDRRKKFRTASHRGLLFSAPNTSPVRLSGSGSTYWIDLRAASTAHYRLCCALRCNGTTGSLRSLQDYLLICFQTATCIPCWRGLLVCLGSTPRFARTTCFLCEHYEKNCPAAGTVGATVTAAYTTHTAYDTPFYTLFTHTYAPRCLADFLSPHPFPGHTHLPHDTFAFWELS